MTVRAAVTLAVLACAVAGTAAGTASPAGQPSVVLVSKQRLYRVTVSPRPALAPVGQLHSWRLVLRTARGIPVAGASIRVDGDMPEHGHGLPTRPRVRALGGGRYELQGMKFQMGGHWYVTFRIAARLGRDVARVDFVLPG